MADLGFGAEKNLGLYFGQSEDVGRELSHRLAAK
jgi:hypothetical protein